MCVGRAGARGGGGVARSLVFNSFRRMWASCGCVWRKEVYIFLLKREEEELNLESELEGHKNEAYCPQVVVLRLGTA